MLVEGGSVKRYKLLKDLPTFRAGQLAYISKTGNLIAGTPENQKTTETGLIIMIYHETTLKKFPNILTEWFEEIPELTGGIHWKPNNGDEYWYTDDCGGVYRDRWDDEPIHVWRYSLGLIKRTKEECEKARNRRLAEVRLQRTSTFKPDFENDNGGWVVYYNPRENRLEVQEVYRLEYGEIVRYETEEDALKSIKENERDWRIHFGVE